ncbi:MAG: hypothetical protein RBR08_07120 [Desulforegulaceae bacterium]|nr:hypothetical protein [Desulforegulaceae bacterium]
MKHLSVLLFCLFFMFSCSSKESKSKIDFPQWYFKIVSSDFIIRGTGAGLTFKEAQAEAFAKISSQINVMVEEEIDIIKKRQGTEIASYAKQQIKIGSQNKINNARLLKSEIKNNFYFTAYEVDSRPFYMILAEKIKNRFEKDFDIIPKNLKFTGNPLIISSHAAKQIEKTFVNSGGKGTKEVFLNLERKNNSWILSSGADFVYVPEIFNVLNLKNSGDGLVKLSLLDKNLNKISNRLQNEKQFRFLISTKEKSGFVSVFNLYSDGRVSILAENLEVKENTLFYPVTSSENIFEAGLLEKGHAVLDYYIAVYSKNPVNCINFRKAGCSLAQGEGAYLAHGLADLLYSSDVDSFYCLAVETVP